MILTVVVRATSATRSCESRSRPVFAEFETNLRRERQLKAIAGAKARCL